MMVSLVQWHAVIGIFYCQRLAISTQIALNLTHNFDLLLEILFICWHYFGSTFIFLLLLVYLFLFLQYHGDIESKPRPKNYFKKLPS